MRQFNNPLFDVEFLKQLTEHKEREIYARIISLTFAEDPVEEIQGRVTQGSINVDGTSAVRRTCSLTLIAKDININDFYWGLKTKFKLEIGVKNNINPLYDDIIWFPGGMYVITSFSTSQATNNYTIQIQGKDKMCLLNGDLGGNLPASIDFGQIEIYNKTQQKTVFEKLLLKNIIREALHTYAQEPYHNIIINDLDEAGMELLEYRGAQPIYLIYNNNTNQFTTSILSRHAESTKIYVNGKETTIDKLENYMSLVEQAEETATEFTQAPGSEETYTAAKIQLGDTAGYRITDLVYAGQLISSIGESLTSAVLDKIKNMLGEYEYFYDLYGRFIFQKKKIYINYRFNNEVKYDDDRFIMDSANNTSTTYQFEGSSLITSYKNNPVLTDLKNDYSIWGVRKSLTGVDIPIHLRYAIDIKPTEYTSISFSEEDVATMKALYPDMVDLVGQKSTTYTTENYDWREIIYQMSNDFYRYGQHDDFLSKIIEANKESGLYTDGTTGYEQYYLDLNGFWREIYNPEKEEWKNTGGWTPMKTSAPDQLNFWFDFLDTGELEQFSVKAIGDRTKVVNDSNVKSIYFRDVPEVIYISSDEDYELIEKSNSWHYTRIQQLPMSLFNISAQGKSAYDELEELMYKHSYCAETINLTSVPVYHLEPNTRIFVYDEASKINGEYIVSKFTIPLAYNGTMSITATKAPTNLY